MLDIKFIRENTEAVKTALRNRQRKPALIDELLSVDERRRETQTKYDALKTEKNKASKEITGGGDKAAIVAKMQTLDQNSDHLEAELKEIMPKYEKLLESIPNIPSADTPVGKDESENVVLRKWGEPTKFDFEPLDHVELGKRLDLIDTELASKVSGARFCYLKNEAVLLEFALIQWGLQILLNKDKLQAIADLAGEDFDLKPFVPVLPPDMIRTEMYHRIGRLTDENTDDKYAFPNDDLWLAGSAEHTLLSLHMDQTLAENEFPKRYVGFSTAFRREAGTYGKDVTGILRRHQFDKLEMLSFTPPDVSDKEQRFLIAIQEYLMQQLRIPYHVIILCTGDMGYTNIRHIDVEMWMPGQGKYRETNTSDHNSDYQTRGLGLKVKRKDGSKAFAHSNDATVFAIGRMLIAIMENYQQKDGSIRVPEVLVPYVGKTEIRR